MMILDHSDYWSEVKQVQTGFFLWVIIEKAMNSNFQDKFCKSVYTSTARDLDTEIENAQSLIAFT